MGTPIVGRGVGMGRQAELSARGYFYQKGWLVSSFLSERNPSSPVMTPSLSSFVSICVGLVVSRLRPPVCTVYKAGGVYAVLLRGLFIE